MKSLRAYRLGTAALFAAAAVAAASCLMPAAASAQEWPTRSVRIIVPNGPGGGTDIVSRILAQALQEKFGQPFVVENKPGAGTTLGADTVAKSAPDGYNLLMMSNAHAVSGAGHPNLKYKPVDDFAMVTMVGTVPLVLVTSPEFPPKTVKEIIDAAKKDPGKYNFASVGAGTSQHFAGELFRVQSGTDIKHVPYRTTPNVLTSLITNEVQMTFELLPAVQSQIAAGKVRAIAVTSPERFPSMPNVPTIMESGLPYNVTSWYGLAAPAGTPKPVIDKLNAALVEILARPDIVAQISKTGIAPRSSTPEALTKHVSSEIAKWKDLIQKAGIGALQ